MWPDNETERDFLNFSGVADTIAETVIQANGRPTSIGVFGSPGWRQVVDDQTSAPLA